MTDLNGLLIDNDREAIKHFSNMIKNGLGPDLIEIRLFGSKIKGLDSIYSDIDILNRY